ncbi:MAG: hypothetical protein ACI4WW_02685 [Candidatus Coprovivens sp.]
MYYVAINDKEKVFYIGSAKKPDNPEKSPSFSRYFLRVLNNSKGKQKYNIYDFCVYSINDFIISINSNFRYLDDEDIKTVKTVCDLITYNFPDYKCINSTGKIYNLWVEAMKNGIKYITSDQAYELLEAMGYRIN